MGPVALVVSSDAALTVAAAATLCAALCAALLGAALVRRARRRRAHTDAALARSRDEVEALSRKLEELSEEVARSQRAAELDREYVITSLGGGEPTGVLDHPDRPGSVVPPRPSHRQLTKVLEDQLVETLARTPRTSALRTRGVELAVRAVSLGHGVRRALSPDVLDRAAAEAQVARRRSRRDRRRELRDARRLRAARPRDQEVA